jgi:glycosyltransferase involved in cell wall biosynthesis
LVRVTVARPTSTDFSQVNSVSVIIAARNEEGNIRDLLARIPQMAPKQEIIFVEGNSTDDTWGEITRVMNEARNPDQKVIALQQEGKGKGDAVRAGFAVASGEILMILDADISVPPEELPKFVRAIAEEKCQFANGSRLVYPMDDDAMRFLNLLGNRFFGMLFTYLLSQPIRDTLCGTKVLRRTDYETIAANRSYFGEFDPFGDFDLLFGAARLSLKIRDIPVHYKERTYGETNISRFSHGLLLFRMSWIAAKRLKFVKVNLASKK